MAARECGMYGGEERCIWGNLTERDYVEDLGKDGILKKQDWRPQTGLIWAVLSIAVNPQVP